MLKSYWLNILAQSVCLFKRGLELFLFQKCIFYSSQRLFILHLFTMKSIFPYSQILYLEEKISEIIKILVQ